VRNLSQIRSFIDVTPCVGAVKVSVTATRPELPAHLRLRLGYFG
jgi:hypothetical protein